MPIIRQRVEPDSVVYTDGLAVYDMLDVAGFEHHRIDRRTAFANGRGSHINGLENFWSQAERHLRRYNGVPKGLSELFLKECEWRFHYGAPRELLETLFRSHLS